jgi:nitroimidazol reductase NimA-like FMN-containing flavoprotein (pyridoxamine 5'-phosphate oxidase superfamily)
VTLDGDVRALLNRARIGMLALNGHPLPLVTPAAFHHGGSAVWMTTSRHAVKVAIARRDPRAAFLVESERRGVLVQGLLEIFDPRTLRGPLRAALEGPGFAVNIAGYALKNAPFVAGYLMELATIPGEWWPQNRVLLRLRVDRLTELPKPEAPAAAPARLPVVPSAVGRAVARNRVGQLCWSAGGTPQLAPAMWTVDGPDVLAWLSGDGALRPREGARAAVVVERHHAFRATRMQGACVRGRLGSDTSAAPAMTVRYGAEPAEEGVGVRLAVERVTWWQGFHVRSARAEAQVR